jgi:hypothetical protein
MSFSIPTALSRAVIGTALAAAVALAPVSAEAQGRGRPSSVPFNVVPITITSVALVNGQLVANGLAGTQAFQTLLTLTAQEGAACPILNLQLGPINLNLLGLVVETSEICLDITAHQGGGLLGDLLCAVANLLSQGVPIGTILTTNLTVEDATQVTNALTQILNQAVFVPLTSSSAVIGASCNVLNLAIGPVDLTLLGLQVQLDDCDGGPVTLDITANPAGGLLGQLLCGLAGGLNSPTGAIVLLQRIAALIGLLLA